MAGAIERGFDEEPETSNEDSEPTFKPVIIETKAFEAETIGLSQMPGDQVIDVLTTPGIAQLPKMVKLFKLAINDPAKNEDFDILNFGELTEVLGQWVSRSEIPMPPALVFGMFNE